MITDQQRNILIQKRTPENINIFKEFLRVLLPSDNNSVKILTDLGFFSAPASTKHHASCPGGLVDHSLGVLHWFGRFLVTNAEPILKTPEYFTKIANVSLLHDVCKTSCYKETKTRVKTENDEWIESSSYEYVDDYPIGHGEKSLDIITNDLHINLSKEERLAIRWHMGSFGLSSSDLSLYSKAIKTSLLLFPLHTADMMDTLYDRENNNFLKKLLTVIPY